MIYVPISQAHLLSTIPDYFNGYMHIYYYFRRILIMTSEEQKYEDALNAVERGDNSAKTKIAWYKLSGHGGAEKDEDGAVVLLEERVKDRDTEAMWMLGECNEFGIGTEQDIERAGKLYKQSSERGNRIGKILMDNKSKWYERGSGYLKMKRL